MIQASGQPPHLCQTMHFYIDRGSDSFLGYSDRFREYFLWERRPSEGDLGIAQSISYCPWCGVKLPDSLRELWFDELWALLGEDYDLLEDTEGRVPADYLSGAWWRSSSEIT
jgi:hypothetical protein